MPNKFQLIRQQKGLTQEEVAEATSISPKFISAIENGRRNPSWMYAVQLADFYGVSLDDFRETTNTKTERND
ncbi:MAG: helix-turn-helix transcriptional regulator [Ruminococcus flavefaciens]|nr:helix-turn-helix transcriptional regulator [Ruminococcus flavefaciens]